MCWTVFPFETIMVMQALGDFKIWPWMKWVITGVMNCWDHEHNCVCFNYPLEEILSLNNLRMDVYLAHQKLNHQHHVTCFLDVWILKKLFRCGSNVGLPSLELHLSRSPQRWFYATVQYWSRFDHWHIATLPHVCYTSFNKSQHLFDDHCHPIDVESQLIHLENDK